MPLENGTRLGPYQVTAQLGAGGMGEVCRARDTRLNRDVALKVLPEAFVSDPSRMIRFQREAQLLATLNHPNIAAIYGFEEGRAIVMELVEGQTLAELIERGPMPPAEALPLARQIAEALEYAHDKGVIHRDLKPANIKVTPDGTVKVLDFGLAKAMGDGTDSSIDPGSSMSPTLSLAASYAGVILGTAAYMAPEQAKGKTVDRRADVWAFGVVLFEMLTGRRTFVGDSIAETLAGVIKEPVAFGALPSTVPPAIRSLLTRCLDRDVRRRLQSIAEARIVLDDAIAGVTPGDTKAAGVAGTPSRLPWAIAALAFVVALGAVGWIWTRPAPVVPPAVQFALTPPDGATLTAFGPNAPQFAVSPDGRYVAFIVDESVRTQVIWVRPLDSIVSRRMERTEGARFPFWSPDSRHIGYFADGKMMRVALDGGAPLVIADARNGEGGAWLQGAGEDVIVFAPEASGPLHRVPAQGGVPVPVTTLGDGEVAHSFPQALRDGTRFLYLVEGKSPGIYLQTLSPGLPTRISAATSRAMYSPPGYLLFMRDNTLFAQRWNQDTLQTEGEAVTVAEEVRSGAGNGRNAFSVSATGVLAYRPVTGEGLTRAMWYTREGKPDGVLLEAGDFVGELEVSPDGRRLSLTRGEGIDLDVWVKDLTSGVLSRVTNADGRDSEAVWSPDSRRLAYVHSQDGVRTFHETLLGSGRHQKVSDDAAVSLWLDAWTPDGISLVAHHGGGGGVTLIPALQDGGRPPADARMQQLFDESYAIDQVRLSPDGKWVAYTSFETGRAEIMVATFPAFTERRQISTDGGVQPLWRRDGRELFFAALPPSPMLMAVEVKAGTTFETGQVRQLFATPIPRNSGNMFYTVTADGQRFLMLEPAVPTATGPAVEPLHIITNWTSLLGQ
jgi:Tol biopolymer transport system component